MSEQNPAQGHAEKKIRLPQAEYFRLPLADFRL